MRESDLQRRVVRMIRRRGHFAGKIHAGRYGQAGWPDVLAIVGGHAVFLEVKVGANEPSPLQLRMMRELEESGATVEVVRSEAEAEAVIAIVEGWD